jgi:hypothetical protein
MSTSDGLRYGLEDKVERSNGASCDSIVVEAVVVDVEGVEGVVVVNSVSDSDGRLEETTVDVGVDGFEDDFEDEEFDFVRDFIWQKW